MIENQRFLAEYYRLCRAGTADICVNIIQFVVSLQ